MYRTLWKYLADNIASVRRTRSRDIFIYKKVMFVAVALLSKKSKVLIK
jgi:hypothetical protein